MQYKTIDVYETFQQFGVIETIKLFENTHGTRDGGGEVKFRYNTISGFCPLDFKLQYMIVSSS
jgi:hypothetical protein